MAISIGLLPKIRANAPFPVIVLAPSSPTFRHPVVPDNLDYFVATERTFEAARRSLNRYQYLKAYPKAGHRRER
jgi:hypothetical protein